MKYSIATLLVLSGLAAAQQSSALSLTTRIPLPNVKGRIDHFGVDVKGQRLFVAGVANHTLEVIDLKSGQRVRTIPDLEEPQGVYYDAGFLEVFQQKDADHYDRIARYATPPGTQTGLFVPELGKLFADVQGRDKQPSEVLVYEAK